MSVIPKGPCTPAIDRIIVKNAGGIKPYIHSFGVDEMYDFAESMCITQKIGFPTNKNKFGGTTRRTIRIQYDQPLIHNVNIEEYFKEIDSQGLPHRGSPRVLAYPYKNHRFDVLKKGEDSYVVASMDGQSVTTSFTFDQVVAIIAECHPMFTYACEVYRSSIAKYDFHCERVSDAILKAHLAKLQGAP